MTKLRNLARSSRAAACAAYLSGGIVAMAGCAPEGDADLESTPDDEPLEAAESQADAHLEHAAVAVGDDHDHHAAAASHAGVDRVLPEVVDGNLAEAQRAQLFAALATHVAEGPREEPSEEDFDLEEEVEELTAEAIEVEGDDEAPAADPDELDPVLAEQYAAFLEHVHVSEFGGFAIGDISFKDEASLINHFMQLHGSPEDKGIYDALFAWPPEDRVFKACFTPDSTSSIAQRERVRELVNKTFAGAAGVHVMFKSGAGFFECDRDDEDTYDFKIYQSTWPQTTDEGEFVPAVTRGCATRGTGQRGNDGVNCSGGTHPWASIVLPETGPCAGSTGWADWTSSCSVGWLEQTAIHEFGHAFGLIHEQVRGEYNEGNADGTGNRWCAAADGDVGIPGGSAAVGDFDEDSVMYYCSPQTPHMSVGDIATIQAALPPAAGTTPLVPDIVARRTDWGTTDDFLVELTVEHGGQSYSELSWGDFFNFRFGSPKAGTPYQMRVTDVQHDEMFCFAQRAPNVYVRGNPGVIPPGGMEDAPATINCYPPAILAAIL